MKRIAVLLSGLALGAAAQAASITYNFNKPLETTEINQTGALGLFDSTLGTLTGVALRVFGSNETTISLSNNATVTSLANTTSVTSLYFSSELVSLDNLFAATNGRELVTLTNSTGLQSVAPRATPSFGPLSASGSRDVAVANGGSLWSSLQAAGGGVFNVNCMSLSGLTVLGGGGNVVASQETTAQCGAEVVYTYDAVTQPPNVVPEPASLALVGLALTGAAAAGRRRKSA